MFSFTAYDAFYTYIGLHLHSSLIEILTSQKIFLALLTIIFGTTFFLTTIKFFSSYLPPVFGLKGGANLLSFAKIIFCLFIGLSLLKIGSKSEVKNYKRQTWHTNDYIAQKLPDAQNEYRVSFLFDILSRSTEEVAFFLTRVVDKLFKSAHSQAEAPSYFYKAVMFAGASSIDDPRLKEKINFYTGECIDKLLPTIESIPKTGRLDAMYSGELDQQLAAVKVSIGPQKLSCLDLKNEIRNQLRIYAQQKTRNFPNIVRFGPNQSSYGEEAARNLFASQSLVNHYLEQREDFFGNQKASMLPGTTARIFQYLNRAFSWDGLLSVLGRAEDHGAALAATRSQEFSEHLQRAPHVQGFVKMMLIALFPILVFFLAAGKWKVLVFWTAVYFSVLLWSPIWTLLYHITTSIALSTDALAAFGKLSDGVSLYSAQLITSRLYYYYAMYSWLQILIGPLPTAMLAWNLKPLLFDSSTEQAPQIIQSAENKAKAIITG